MKKDLLLFLKNCLLRSGLTVTLLLAFCVRVLSQGTGNIPKEEPQFYKEDGKTGAVKTSTRADNDVQWSFKSVIENCFDEKLLGKEAWMMTADGETQLKVTFEYKANDDGHNILSSEVAFVFYKGDDLFHDDNVIVIGDDPDIVGTYTKEDSKRG